MKVVPAVARFPSPLSFLALLPPMVCLLALLAGPMAGHSATLVLKAQWPGYRVGWPRAMAFRNNYAYVATYPLGFQVIDLSNPALPVRVGICDIPDARIPYGVALAANCAYVAAGDRLEVIDISDPAHPRSLAPVTVTAMGLTAQGNFAYVLTGDEPGLRVFDLTDPAQPRPAGSYSGLYGTPNALVVSGRYGYLISGYRGLEVLDLSDPAAPVRAGACATGTARAVTVSGDFAYVAGDLNTLQVIDIAEPSAPKVVSAQAVSSHPASNLVVAGRYAYVALPAIGLYVFDVTDPAMPLTVGRSPYVETPRALAVWGNFLCVGGELDELVVLDLTDPAKLKVASRFDTELDQVRGVAVSGGYAYLGQRGRLQVLDVQDPGQPRRTQPLEYSHAAFALQGDYAYVVSMPYLDVLDITDPPNPTLVRHYDSDLPGLGRVVDAAIAGDYIYLATDSRGLQVLGFTDEPALKLVGNYPVTGFSYHLALSGNSACLTLYDQQRHGPALDVIDVTQPAKPRLAGAYTWTQVPGFTLPLAAAGNRVYLVKSATLEVIDISIPAKPQLVARFAGLSSNPPVEDIAVMDNYLYVAASGAGLLVYEMPALPAFNPPAIVEGQLRLSWNQSAIGMVLRQSASLTPPNWQIVSNTVSTNAITLPLSGTAGFFRLAK